METPVGALQVRDYGGPDDAPVVVCVHGLGGSALNYDELGPRLAGTRRVVAVDLPGHGGSPPPADWGGPRGAVPALVAAVAAAGDALSPDRSYELVGHSLGGVAAIVHAGERPGRVARLALLGPPVPGRSAGRDWALTARLAALRLPGVRALVARQMLGGAPEDLVAKQLGDATPHVDRVPAQVVADAVAETRARLAAPDARLAQRLQWDAILGTMSLLAAAGAWSARLDAVRAPVLWLHGDDDKLSPVEAGRALVGERPGWRFVRRPGVGHLPHLEDPDWTAAQLGAAAG
ncbi:alpha/beta fold hydrolase [Nocardioides sp. SYSU D00038]|uniref:alpha/beta fold hydrolase n=1 Tax=Nocardioides sp. SYSU D00038 TaxID=2812554 RepID=UPI0019689799|nr:alpha/beta hydrolase [Nocardioides sp. SYSU D00038]